MTALEGPVTGVEGRTVARGGRGVKVLVVLLAFALPGCLGGGPSEGDGTTTPTPTTGPTSTPSPPTRVPLLLDFAFEDCEAVHVVERPDLAAVQALLPEGFTAREDADLAGRGVLATSFHACARYTSATTTINDTFLGRVAIDVEPPDGFAEVTADRHAYVLRMLSQEDVFAAVWEQAGYPVFFAPANVSLTGDPLPLRRVEASVGPYAVQGAAAATATGGGTHAFYHRVDGGHIVWTGLLAASFSHAGTGSIAVPDDDPATAARGGPATVLAAVGQAHADEELWLDLRPWPA